MNKALVEARVKVERRAMTAIISRKKARIATQQFACVVAQAKLKANLHEHYVHSKCEQCGWGAKEADLLLCDKCDSGFHLSCVRPILASVPQGSWFCADCSHQFQIKADYVGKEASSNEVATNQNSSCRRTVAENKALGNTELVGGHEKSDSNKTTHHTGFSSTTSDLLGKAKIFSRVQTDSSVNSKGSWGGGGAALEDIGKWSSKFVQNTPKAILDRETSGGSAFDGDGRRSPNSLIEVLVPNQMDLPDMAVDEENLLTEAMLRNITETARAGQSDKAEAFKKKEKKQSTTKRVSKSKLVSEPEGEVESGSTGLEEEQMTENKEHLGGGNIGGDQTEILLNGGDEENEETYVDSDSLKKLKGKRPVSPYKEKVGGGHQHKTHKGLSSKRKKRNKEATVLSKKSPFVRSVENDDGDQGPRGREDWLPGYFFKSMATEDDTVKIMEGGWEDHAVTAENALARGASLVAGLVKCANNYRALCKKAEADLNVRNTHFDEMENEVKAAKRNFKDANKK